MESDWITPELFRYMTDIRRELHRYPEVGFDLPLTTALLRRELDAMDIPYTEQYGKSSVVAFLTPPSYLRTVGLRADTDALFVREATGLPYASRYPDRMHACGHDLHTAALLGAARVLRTRRDTLPVRVALIFQACEENAPSGAARMCRDGLMEQVDVILGQHCDPGLDAGTLGYIRGPQQAACETVRVTFHGRAAHAARPQAGCDAIAMGVRAYNGIQTIVTRLRDPLEPMLLSVGVFQGGTLHNVVPETAELRLTFRYFSQTLAERAKEAMAQLFTHAAEEFGGTADWEYQLACPVLSSCGDVVDNWLPSAERTVGKAGCVEVARRMSSEDYAWYLREKPGAFFRLGTRRPGEENPADAHTSLWNPDERAMATGAAMFIQTVLDGRV